MGVRGRGQGKGVAGGRQQAACAETCSMCKMSVQQGDTLNTAWQSYITYL